MIEREVAVNLICVYLLESEIKKLKETEPLTNQEELWLETCERELVLIKQLRLDSISYYGCSRDEFVSKIKNYTISL
jgi:hypothetical protein